LPFLPANQLGAAAAPATGNLINQAQSDQQLTLAIFMLQSVRRTLDAADHDYGGHRAAAVRLVVAAEHQLTRALGVRMPGPGAVPHIREPQIFSNAQLAASIPVLAGTIAMLKSTPFEYGGHRDKAIVDIAAAIVELELALEYIASRRKRILQQNALLLVETPVHKHKKPYHKTATTTTIKKPSTVNVATTTGSTGSTERINTRNTLHAKKLVPKKPVTTTAVKHSAQARIHAVAHVQGKAPKSMVRPIRPPVHLHVHMPHVRRR